MARAATAVLVSLNRWTAKHDTHSYIIQYSMVETCRITRVRVQTFWFFIICPPPLGLKPPGTCKTKCPYGPGVCRGARDYGSEHWTGAQARAFLNLWPAECQGLRQSQHRTEHRQMDTHTVLESRLKSLNPPGIELGPPRRFEGSDSIDHTKSTDPNINTVFILCGKWKRFRYVPTKDVCGH